VRSGCEDDQTSCDVGNVHSFRLPKDVGPGGAGGACTNSMMAKFYHPQNNDPTKPESNFSYAELLLEMRDTLKGKGFTQVPQLSSSYQLNLGEAFCIKPPGTQRTKALLIGINYVGQEGGLRGCHNDVKMMKQFITDQGFSDSPEDMKILMDDGENEMPTRENIEAAMRWLADARPGDALFLQYSGHGSHIRDESGDEESGMDQTLIPVDYEEAGQIIDDWIFGTVVMPLPAGVSMFAVMDCCHSGTIMDLPYVIAITPELAVSEDQEENRAKLKKMTVRPNPTYAKKYLKHKGVLAKCAAAAGAGCLVGGFCGPVGMCLGCIFGMCAVLFTNPVGFENLCWLLNAEQR